MENRNIPAGSKLIKGALILSAAGLLGKVLSALYRVPYQNLTGDLGYYVYQQIYPFYGAVMVISMYGFPVIISKMMLEDRLHRSKGEEIAAASFILLSLFFLPLCILLWVAAPFLAEWMGDEMLAFPLQIISLSVLTVPFLASVRGYGQGRGNMVPTAVSHLSEQVLRVAVILIFAWVTYISQGTAYQAGTGAALGSVIGSAAGAVVLFFVTFKSHPISFTHLHWPSVFASSRQIGKRLFVNGMLVSLGAMMFIIYQLVDALMVIRMLQGAGLAGEEAMVAKGVFDRGQPLLQFGTLAATAFSLAVIPYISREVSRKNEKEARIFGELAIRVSIILGAAAALGLWVIAESVNVMLFVNGHGTEVLRWLGLTLAVSGAAVTSAAVLQGRDHFYLPAIHLSIGIIVKISLNILLIPAFTTIGAAAATVTGIGVTALLNIIFIYRKGYAVKIQALHVVKGGAALLFMLLFTWILHTCLMTAGEGGRGVHAIAAVCSATGGGGIFLHLLLRWKVISSPESSYLPGMDRLEKILLVKERSA